MTELPLKGDGERFTMDEYCESLGIPNDSSYFIDTSEYYKLQDDYNAAKFDQGKPRYSLIDSGFLLELAKVMTMGAEKYSDDSWKTVPNAKERYKDALLRHIYAEEKVDEESGLSHLAHAAANLQFLFYLEDMDD